MSDLSRAERKSRCKGKREYKTLQEAENVCAAMEEKYGNQFVYYEHLNHYHLAHKNPILYSATRSDNYCHTCRRRYQSANYEEHCGRKYHQAIVRKQERLRALLDKDD